MCIQVLNCQKVLINRKLGEDEKLNENGLIRVRLFSVCVLGI